MTRERAKELLPVIQAYAEGKPIQIGVADQWFDWNLMEPSGEFSYRVAPIEFPQLGEGQEWWNPENCTAEKIGVTEGWRPLIKYEISQPGDQTFEKEAGVKEWSQTVQTLRFHNTRWTYRTKRPLPEPVPKVRVVPLGPEDVPPGSVIKGSSDNDKEWAAIVNVCFNGLWYSGPHGEIVFGKFQYLLDAGAMIKRPWSDTFEPCSKEVRA